MSEEVSKIISQLQVRVDEANKKAESIIAEAEARAQQLLADAQTEIAKKQKAAEEELARREKAHAEKLKQAVRDTLIELKQKTIQSVLNQAFKASLGTALNDPDVVGKAIFAMGKEFSKHFKSDVKVILGPGLFEKLGQAFRQEAHKAIESGLEIELDSSIKGGFKIGAAKEGYVYDFSNEALVELFTTAYGAEIEKQIFSGEK